MAVFVTVGTTSFNALIEIVNEPIFHAILCHLGYKKLCVQFGNGSIEPCSVDEAQIRQVRKSLPFEMEPSSSPHASLELHSFRYRDNLDACFADSQLVISHGGAGSCMEALTPPGKRKLIIVINEKLMHNHQEELALSLLEGRHAFVTKTSDLLSFLSTGKQNLSYETKASSVALSTLIGPFSSPEEAGLLPFHRGNRSDLINFINQALNIDQT